MSDVFKYKVEVGGRESTSNEDSELQKQIDYLRKVIQRQMDRAATRETALLEALAREQRHSKSLEILLTQYKIPYGQFERESF